MKLLLVQVLQFTSLASGCIEIIVTYPVKINKILTNIEQKDQAKTVAIYHCLIFKSFLP